MPIRYWSLWGQPRSVTSGDLSSPCNSYDEISRVTSSHVLTPITSTLPIQVNRTTPSCVFSRFRWNLVEGCSSYDVIISRPDLTWPIVFTKSCAIDALLSISYGKLQYDTTNGVASSSENSWGVLPPPPPSAGEGWTITWLNPICIVNINDKKVWESKGAAVTETKSSLLLVTD